ncbi:tannase/feruloyl esterase family alpha/beta hydrolase [Actinomycetes bacterium KLBMP 9797]
MRLRTGCAVAAVATIVVGLGPPASPAAAGEAGIRPVRDCARLVGDFALPTGAAHVTAATPTPGQADAPEHCDVRGYVEPAVRFHLRLPTSTYAGRYLQYGCGGFCGDLGVPAFPDCGGRPPGDFAVAATDDGHVGRPPFPFGDGGWAAGDRAARDDWQFRAPHVVSQAAKRVIAAYYGSPPRRSYFSGCSNGGREALLLAQRYPDDFDGIVAEAPAAAITPLIVHQAWLARSNTAADGQPILTGAKLPALHAAVVAACDGLDGLTDGQVDEPGACRFDPATLACPAGTDTPACLTAAQVEVVRRVYAGATDPAGRRLYPGGQPYGSEPAWYGWLIPAPELGGLSAAAALADNYLRYMGYPIGEPHSSLADFAFTVAEFDRLTPEGVRANALSLDLSRFRRAGGKLVIWHGGSDQAIPPAGTLDYYQRLWQRDGGPHRTQRYARLFMVPTLYHCADGYRLTEFDPLPELVRWVERGDAPDRVVARGRDAQGQVVRSRPVFPYPLRARYDGSGSVDDAGNFVPAAPPGPPRDVIRWVGEDLYDRPGPVVP